MAIKQNEGTFDRFARIILGGVCMLIGSYFSMPGFMVLALMIIGLYLMFSGLAGQCVLYKIFGVSTCK